MASDKSLATEIEAVLNADNVDMPRGCLVTVDASAVSLKIAAHIAALQSRAFEDGARWMRGRAKLSCLDYGEACLDRSIKLLHEHDLPRTGDAIGWADAATGCARLVEAILLQPEGERSDA